MEDEKLGLPSNEGNLKKDLTSKNKRNLLKKKQ